MKKFFNILFISFCFFLALSTNADCQEVLTAYSAQSAPYELSVKLGTLETDIATANQQPCEISATSERKNDFGSSPELCNEIKTLKKLRYNTPYNVHNRISHNISSYLENEICTRAP